MEDEYFPRGGKRKSSNTHSTGVADKRDKDTDLFKSGGEPVTKKTKKATKKGTSNKSAEGYEEDEESQVQQVKPLSLKFMCSGMLVLGMVKEVRDYNLIIALPNGLKGMVPITNISDAYTGQLKQFADSQGQDVADQELSSLHQLFKYGSIVRCKVLSVERPKDGMKAILLTINPKSVNENVSASSLKEKMVLCGCVSSQEDHGYVIDLGVRGLKAFLPNALAENYIKIANKGKELRVGQYVHTFIQEIHDLGNRRYTAKLSITPSVYKTAALDIDTAFNCLSPGMIVQCHETKVAVEGLCIKFVSYSGTIHSSHLPMNPSAYSKVHSLKAIILAIHPTTKAISLSVSPHLIQHHGVLASNHFGSLRKGDLVEEASVVDVISKAGVHCHFPDKVKAFAPLRHLSDEEVKNIEKAFRKGSIHRCRVLDFNPMEDLVIVSFKKSAVEGEYLRIDEIKAGDIREVTIREFHDRGVAVKLSKQISGIIPKLHLSDVTLKRPHLKFEPNNKLTCKVLRVTKKPPCVILTHKASLVNSSLPIPTRYGELRLGQECLGFVVQIAERSLLVAFFNNVKGIVPHTEMADDHVQFPRQTFSIGQVVQCRVLSIDLDNERLLLTLRKDDKPRRNMAHIPADFEIGKLVDCTITEKIDSGLKVEIEDSGKPAFLPKSQLSDSHEHANALWDLYQAGDIIQDAMYFGKDRTATLSIRASLLYAVEEQMIVKGFDELQSGMTLIGCVKTFMDYGIFVQFPGNLVGLAPHKFISNSRMNDLTSLFKLNQTVVATVMTVDEDRERFLISLRVSDGCHGDAITRILLTSFLSERKALSERLAKDASTASLSSTVDGSLVSAKVISTSGDKLICKLKNGVKAVATKVKGLSCKVGSNLDCVVLFVDLTAKQVELSVATDLVAAVRSKGETPKLKSSQVLDARIELIKDSIVVVSLTKMRHRGWLAYLSRKMHPNALLNETYEVGQTIQVQIVSLENEMNAIIAVDAQAEEVIPSAPETQQVGSLKIGVRRMAELTDITDTELTVTVKGQEGRIHITEIADDVTQGTKLDMNMYKKGEKIRVKVIGFNQRFSFREFPKTGKKILVPYVECSIKPSKLARKGFTEEDRPKSSVKVGEKVWAFMEEKVGDYIYMAISCTLRGRVHLHALSDDLQVLSNVEANFKCCYAYRAGVIALPRHGSDIVQLSMTSTASEVESGCITKCVIQNIKPYFMTVSLGQKYSGRIWLTDVMDAYADYPFSKYKKGDFVSCYVLSCDAENKYKSNLSLRPSRVTKSGVKGTKDPEIIKSSQLNTGTIVRGYVKKCTKSGAQIILAHDVECFVPLEKISQVPLPKGTKLLRPGEVVTVKVLQCKNKQVKVSMLEHDTGVTGLVKDKLKLRAEEAVIEKLKKQERRMRLQETRNAVSKTEAKKSDIKPPTVLPVKDRTSEREKSNRTSDSDDEPVDDDEAEEEEEESNEVYEEEESDNDDEVDDDNDGEENDDGSEEEEADDDGEEEKEEEDDENSDVSEEDEVEDDSDSNKKNVMLIKGKEKKTSVDSKDTKLNLTRERQSDNKSDRISGHERTSNNISLDTSKSSKRKLDNSAMVSLDSKKKRLKCGAVEDVKPSDHTVKSSRSSTAGVARLQLSEGFSWDTEFNMPNQKEHAGGAMSSDESDHEDNSKKYVKKTKAQKFKEKKEKEQQLFELERLQTSGEIVPQSADDFDRLILHSPNSSLIWLRFMAFHLETTEIEQARAVAERALKTINFREEQEKLNIWMAYLNLENMYGTPESVDTILKRALQYNEPMRVYQQLVNIYIKSAKMQEAEQVYNTMLRRFSGKKEIWISTGIFYFKQDRLDSARKLLQRCLKSLDKRDHLEVISKFAQLEFGHGDAERGHTMFENIITNYPKRSDLWSVYIDMVTKAEDLTSARQLYERAIHLSLPARKMKFFFKKYLSFETKYGDEDRVEAVRQKAIAYVGTISALDDL